MEGAIIWRWKRAVPGRERESWNYAKATDLLAATWRSAERCGPHEWVNSWGNEEDHMLILRGDPMTLVELMAAPDFIAHMARGALVVDGFRYTLAGIAPTAPESFPGWEEALAQLAA
jgi:hypothetical protein